MEFAGKRALIVGAGKSGIAAFNLLYDAKANPVIFDSNTNLDIAKTASKTKAGDKTEIIVGNLSEEEWKSFDFAVLSPGVPVMEGIGAEVAAHGLYILGEIELGYELSKGRLIAITGTNGKTTTTALTGKICEDYYGKCFVVGNIGNPYTCEALNTEDDSVTVAEISSFQLETIHAFHPEISAILNITPDHLNRHKTMENYVKVKEDICLNQTKNDFCVLNYEDEYLKEFGPKCSANVMYFSSARKVDFGCFLKDEDIYFIKDGEEKRLMNIYEMKLLGTHNVENVMAAICMCYAAGIPFDNIIASVKEFTAVEHRIEYVCTKKGVDYYNDSKGTNPDAAIKGIQAMNRPTVLIGGGYDKGNTYDEWIEAFNGKVKAFVLLGQTADAIEECARKHGLTEIYRASSLEETVRICAGLAKDGDAVLLSPACASWGMFENYEVRGRMFKDLCRALED